VLASTLARKTVTVTLRSAQYLVRRPCTVTALQPPVLPSSHRRPTVVLAIVLNLTVSVHSLAAAATQPALAAAALGIAFAATSHAPVACALTLTAAAHTLTATGLAAALTHTA
jgi:hypothetical protein